MSPIQKDFSSSTYMIVQYNLNIVSITSVLLMQFDWLFSFSSLCFVRLKFYVTIHLHYFVCYFLKVLGGFDSSNYVTERKWASAPDGVQIPLSIVYRKDLVKLDGSDPLLLYGYGSYEVRKHLQVDWVLA